MAIFLNILNNLFFLKRGRMKVYELIRTSKYIKVMLFLVIFLLLIGGLGYSYTRKVGLYEGLIYTFDTLVFLPPSNPVGIEKGLQIFIMLFGVFVFWFVLWTSLDFAIEGKFEDYFKKVNAMKRAKKMQNHYIICGGGRVGENIAEMLKEKKEKYIIVEREEEVVNSLHKRGINVVEGDVLDEKTLIEVGIKKAKALITVLPETEKNILVTLTARELNPQIKIYARAERKELLKKLKNAGADVVVMPELVGAKEIVEEVLKDKISKG